MKIAISAPPTIDVSEFAKSFAGKNKARLIADPTRMMCEAYGFQTLYRMPGELQHKVRLDVLRAHASDLQTSENLVFETSIFALIADWMRWFWSATPTEKWEKVVAEITPASRRYDTIYHVTEGPQRSYDGYHWLDTRNAVEVSRLMCHLYEDLGVTDKVKIERIAPA